MIKELQTFLTGNVEELLLFKLNLAFHNKGKKKKVSGFHSKILLFSNHKKNQQARTYSLKNGLFL